MGWALMERVRQTRKRPESDQYAPIAESTGSLIRRHWLFFLPPAGTSAPKLDLQGKVAALMV